MTQESAGADAVLGAAAGLAGGALAGAVATFKAASSIMDRISSGPSTQKFHVEKDTVLKAGKIICDQWMLLEREYRDKVELLRIRTVGGDKVTTDVVEAWNDRLVFHDDSYGNRISAYITALKSLSDQLRTSAQQYGFTEEEITATFGPKA
ncbi:hypothetical protein C8D88_101458 [Lentzea atacamensis]|uniref:Uncharacterized protein n=1 Tax=Lentzea atacamensis TaxID=531938 RepID=A0A316IA77_9PSEU|nr:hypothetical protein [Lentzea atacamensis]PWK90442.1 hypothetical protein C8D88_101458 [Lentzea atacamensis]